MRDDINLKEHNLPLYNVKGEFFSWRYLFAQLCTLFIFFLGFKWTLLGLYWLPYMFNPLIYTCIMIFWFYYNYMWLRTALYIPTSMLLIDRTYSAMGKKISIWNNFYLTICKIGKLRKEDVKVKRTGGLVRLLARSFIKHGIVLNFRRDDAERMSTALFIHCKRKVLGIFKGITPYLMPTFVAIMVLTPMTLFLSSFNYRYLMDKLNDVPIFTTFGMYIITLPFSLTFVFLALNLLAVSVLSPLLGLPYADLYACYLKENDIKVDYNKKQTPSWEGVMALIMLVAAGSFYVSTMLAKYAPAIEVAADIFAS